MKIKKIVLSILAASTMIINLTGITTDAYSTTFSNAKVTGTGYKVLVSGVKTSFTCSELTLTSATGSGNMTFDLYKGSTSFKHTVNKVKTYTWTDSGEYGTWYLDAIKDSLFGTRTIAGTWETA